MNVLRILETSMEKALGQIAYEEDVRRFPCYQDGGIRPNWDELSDITRESWERNPTPREFAPIDQNDEIENEWEDC